MAQASFETDAGYGAAALGLIVLSTDETLEPELGPVLGRSGIATYHSRIPSAPDVTPATLAQMEADLPRASALLPDVTFSAIGYGCTSGATVIGAERVADLINGQKPGVPVTNPLSAVLAAADALGVKRLAMLTPYVPAVSAVMQDRLRAAGLQISGFASFEQQEEAVVARITEASVLEAVLALGAGDCDAVFASCTNLRSFGVIETAEARLDKPVITSNSALVWHMGKLAGLSVDGPGRLFANG